MGAMRLAFPVWIGGSPRWSPDGKQIAFDSRPNGHSQIMVVEVEVGRPKKLTEGEFAEIVPG